ncbi:hypothetical protein RJ639_046510 [Escallonia herrerae]|uniref:Uncharacterized protein n=1 Tax=Escallonia herrerae TaxID=1293975 RepID=A0AA88W7P1_9ASTE|nr:hypothetical protein RJ639_046510 [Escallonia herrerae]
MKAASDYGALTASVGDFQWSQNFKEPPSIWGNQALHGKHMKVAQSEFVLHSSRGHEMLRPIPVALASCTRFFEAMSAMRESFATLQNLRVSHSSSSPATPANDPSQSISGIREYVTPPPCQTIL